MRRTNTQIDKENMDPYSRFQGGALYRSKPHMRNGRAVLGDLSNKVTTTRHNDFGANRKTAGITKSFNNLRLRTVTKPSVNITTSNAVSISKPEAKVPQLGIKAPLTELDELDKNSTNNPLRVTEYVLEIYERMRETEVRHRVSPNFIANSRGRVTEDVRANIADMLAQLNWYLRLSTETLFLAVHYAEKYLEKAHDFRPHEAPMVAATALMISAKFEMHMSINADNYKSARKDMNMTQAELLDFEGKMLDTIDFQLCPATRYRFGQRYLRATASSTDIVWFGYYFLELSLTSGKLLKWNNSHVAASCIYLAQKTVGDDWTPLLQRHTHYHEDELRECVTELYHLVNERHPKYETVRQKYGSHKREAVARKRVPYPFSD